MPYQIPCKATWPSANCHRFTCTPQCHIGCNGNGYDIEFHDGIQTNGRTGTIYEQKSGRPPAIKIMSLLHGMGYTRNQLKQKIENAKKEKNIRRRGEVANCEVKARRTMMSASTGQADPVPPLLRLYWNISVEWNISLCFIDVTSSGVCHLDRGKCGRLWFFDFNDVHLGAQRKIWSDDEGRRGDQFWVRVNWCKIRDNLITILVSVNSLVLVKLIG